MNDVDDSLLMSFVDGELDLATSREVEAVLRLRPDLARQVRRMREDCALVRAAFNHVLHQPAPVQALPGLGRRDGRWRVSLAAAASALLIGCGVLLGQVVVPQSPAVHSEVHGAARDAALQRLLEDHASGSSLPWSTARDSNRGRITAVSSYRGGDGRFCREFEETRESEGIDILEAGVACRDDAGRWRVRIRYYP